MKFGFRMSASVSSQFALRRSPPDIELTNNNR